MPNYCLSYQLDFAVSLFKDAFKKSKEISKVDNSKKWAVMSLESSQKKAMKMARGKYGNSF